MTTKHTHENLAVRSTHTDERASRIQPTNATDCQHNATTILVERETERQRERGERREREREREREGRRSTMEWGVVGREVSTCNGALRCHGEERFDFHIPLSCLGNKVIISSFFSFPFLFPLSITETISLV
jgi:hypothetical protein